MRIVVWDLPTRIFHWVVAALAVALVVTGKIGGDAMAWHGWCGYAMAAALLFRLVWGVVGGHWSRFAAFPPSLPRAWRYLGGRQSAGPGHNPLGAFSVYLMLLFLALQVVSGLFSETKEDFAGPLSVRVSHDTVRFFTGYHKVFGEPILLGLVAAHLAAVGWYAWRGTNLVQPMVTGEKVVDAAQPGSRDDATTRIRAVVVLSLCSLAVWGLVKLGG